MKKVLIASTALVAAGLVSGTASASEKIKLELGGFSKWWVVGAWQDDKFQANNNAAGVQGDYNTVDIKGDNEVYFKGSTTLDNGIKVGVEIQLEAGGHTDQTTDTIDESFVFLEGGFGKFIVGSKNNGAYLLHVTAPDAAGNWNEGGIITGGYAIAKPSSVATITPGAKTNSQANGGNTTAIVTDNDAEGITYVAPTFYGLTVGASYKPNNTEDNRGATSLTSYSTTSPAAVSDSATTGEIYGVGALYANTFGGVGVKVSAGWATYDINQHATLGNKDKVNEYSTGAQLSYAGFTLGGSYRQVNANQIGPFDFGGTAWDAGLSYASGPYAVSVSYFKSKTEGTANGTANGAGQDEIEFYQVSGKYNLGAGVDVLATVGHAKYEDETGLAQNENKGWAVMTGLSLAF